MVGMANSAGEFPITQVTELPSFIVVLNRLARLGKASRYPPSGSTRWCSFVPDEILAAKWPELKPVERVILIYRGDPR